MPPATTDAYSTTTLNLYATSSTYPLVLDLATAYRDANANVSINVAEVTQFSNVADVQPSYFVTLSGQGIQNNYFVPIAQDAIVVFTGPDVQTGDLSLDQLRAIFQGRISNWSELSGRDHVIVPVSRGAESDVRLEFERMVMGRSRITAGARFVASDSQMVEVVNNTPGAIGYVSIGYQTQLENSLTLDGILPTQQSVQDGVYPLRTMVYMVSRGENDQEFLNWVQSSTGQQVAASRYVPLQPIRIDEN